MKTIYAILCLLSISTACFGEDSRPSGVSAENWVAITDNFGVYVFDVRRHPQDSVRLHLEALKKMLEGSKDKQAVQKQIEKLEKDIKELPKLADAYFCVKKDGTWLILDIKDSDLPSIFRFVE